MSESPNIIALSALTGMVAGAFLVAINTSAILSGIGGLFFGLGFAYFTDKTIEHLEKSK